ncbi:MAG: aminotransferase class V-fold PLP-dependent enzyme [Rhodothermales bacterium]
MLSCKKELFSLPEQTHYLNCAYMSPVSKAVEAAGITGIRSKRMPGAVKPHDFFETAGQTKNLFASLINAPAHAISIIASASYGIATVAKNVDVSAGQNIVIVGEQFPSNVYSWMRKAEETGATIRTVQAPEDVNERGKRWNERVLEAIDKDTAVVAMAHVHWADGTLFDLESIGKRARAVNAAFIIDGTQSIGALPFDVSVIQPDALICAGYKWLMGPYSIGLAYYGPRFSNGTPIEENWITREGSEQFGGLVAYRTTYQPGADRYDVGEKSNFVLLPMLLQALKHLEDWGISNIQRYCADLTKSFCQEIKTLGFEVEDPSWRAQHLFGVRVRDDIPMERLMNAITEANISVSIRGTAVRISPHVYNNESDIQALNDVFKAVANKAVQNEKTGHSVLTT